MNCFLSYPCLHCFGEDVMAQVHFCPVQKWVTFLTTTIFLTTQIPIAVGFCLYPSRSSGFFLLFLIVKFLCCVKELFFRFGSHFNFKLVERIHDNLPMGNSICSDVRFSVRPCSIFFLDFDSYLPTECIKYH